MNRIITFGTFDLFHVGHLRLLERAKLIGDFLIVGVSSDELNFSKKHINAIIPHEDRKLIINSLRCVDKVFTEESLEKKKHYIMEHKADVLVMGDDWRGKLDWCKDVCKVVYLERTPAISSTDIKAEVTRRSSPRKLVEDS